MAAPQRGTAHGHGEEGRGREAAFGTAAACDAARPRRARGVLARDGLAGSPQEPAGGRQDPRDRSAFRPGPGYVYNRGAANLRTQRSHTIGVSINEITNPYFTELTAAIQRAFLDYGRVVFIANSEEDPRRQDDFIAAMREYNADGLVICPARGTSRETLRRLKAQGVACVLVSRDVAGSGLDYAGNANVAGMCEATEHLIGLGHRRIAMLGGNDLVSTGRERRSGYRKALERHGIPLDETLVVEGEATRSFGAAAVRRLLDLDEPATAAVCFNDVIAFGVMLGLRQVGREPGRDFAVIGYDDLAEADLWVPGLSSVRIDTRTLGDTAAKLLLDRIENRDAPCAAWSCRPGWCCASPAADGAEKQPGPGLR